MATTSHRIACIPGDGIGHEVIPAARAVLEAAGRRHRFDFRWEEYDWSCERYEREGAMMPADGLDRLRPFDAILLGAVGAPGVPDHVSLWGLLIPIRRTFQQYVNLRPIRVFEGVPSPLRAARPGEVDFVVVRENVEGEYGEIGGPRWPAASASLPRPTSTPSVTSPPCSSPCTAPLPTSPAAASPTRWVRSGP